jgi:hypothetical protein
VDTDTGVVVRRRRRELTAAVMYASRTSGAALIVWFGVVGAGGVLTLESDLVQLAPEGVAGLA